MARSPIINALLGKQLTFPDETRVILLGQAAYYINSEGKFIRLKIEPIKKEPMIKSIANEMKQ